MTLLQRIEAHLSREGLTPTRLGRELLGDPSFVRDLRRGREPRPETTARVLAYLDRVDPCRS